MKILYLYGNEIARGLAEWLRQQGHTVDAVSDRLDAQAVRAEHYDLLFSYTYRYLVRGDVLDAVNRNAVNLHIAYLPWNRGTNPNQWSWINNTPKGVTLHCMTEQLDVGDILAQVLVEFGDPEQETLESTYNRLNEAAVELAKQAFAVYPFWNSMRKKALCEGDYHALREFEPYAARMKNDYGITVAQFQKLAREIQP